MEGIYAPIVTPAFPAHETVPDYCADLTPEASESLGSMEGMVAPVVQREIEAQRSARAWSTLWPGYTLAISGPWDRIKRS